VNKQKGISWKAVGSALTLVIVVLMIVGYLSGTIRYSPEERAELVTQINIAQDNLNAAQTELATCLSQQVNEEADCASEQSIVDTYAATLQSAQDALLAYDESGDSASSFVDSGSGDSCDTLGGDSDFDGYCVLDAQGNIVDCADGDASIFPGAGEVCADGIDNNCNQLVDCADVSSCDGQEGQAQSIYATQCCAGAALRLDSFKTDVNNCGSCGSYCQGRFTPSGWVADVCRNGKCEAPECASPPRASCFGPGLTQDDALGRLADTVGDLLTICGWSIGWDSDAGCISFSRSY
jgi:hypothetical protein